MRAIFRGDGWGFGKGREEKIFLEGEEKKRLCADRLDQIPSVLTALDETAESGNSDLFAAGFISYEGGVFLEGSASLAREHEFLPFAEFSIFDTRGAAPEHGSETRPAVPSPFTFKEPARAERALSSDEWASGVEAIRDGIARGDVYQVNLSRRTRFSGRIDPFALAEALYADNPVPFAVTLASTGGGWAVVSNSPELFLEVDLAARRAVTKPIKGTIARGKGEADDAARREELRLSAKDAAENVMIVDLMRNDLGKVAQAGGVETTSLRALRSFRHLHHLESTVEARLRPEARLSDVLRATLPGGSITGAPKRAALGFIRELEPVARGAYCGAAGFVRGDGRAVFNVAIRTAVVGRDTVDYHAGCGIVWDSRPDAEWREMESKSREFGAAMTALAAREGE